MTGSSDSGLAPRLRAGMVAGALLGAAALAALAAIEAAYVLLASPYAFDDPGEQVRFVLYALGLALGAGAAAGALGGALATGVDGVAARLGRGAGARAWAARLYTLLAVPAVAWGAAQAFAGRRAQLLPGHHALAIALGAVALAATYGALLGAGRLVDDARAGRLGPGGARGRAALLAAAAAGLYLADARVLPRLYPFFHLGLEAIALGLLVLAVRLATARLPLPRLTAGRGLLAAAVVVLAGGGAVRRLAWEANQRAAAFERTTVEARLLGAAHALHLAPRAMAPPPPPLPPPPKVAAAPLPPGPHAEDADVILITVDALRADRLAPATAPALAALAERGVRFDHAYAQVPHTSFSLATLLTGKYVYSLAALGEEAGRHETLADLFRRERYKTAAFFPPAVFYIDHERFAEVERTAYHFEYVKYEYLAAPKRTDQVIRFFEREQPERAFVWVHYFEPHEPYELHGEPGVTAASPDAARYDGEVRFTDRAVGRLLEWVAANRKRAIVVFTADHGEEFGEHGGRYHGTSLYEEQVHVPLFIVEIGTDVPRVELGTEAGGLLPARRVAGPVGLIDVAPTLLGLADVLPPLGMRGQDLGPWLSRAPGAPPPDARLGPVYAEIGAKKLLASGDDRLLCDLGRDYCELYDVGADPAERHNRAAREPARAASLRARLDAWLGAQSKYEPAAVAQAAAGEPRRALERGRLGDRQAAGELARLLADDDRALRDEAASVLLALPDDPATHAAVLAAHRRLAGGSESPPLRVLALRAGDRTGADALAAATAPGADADPRVRGEAALALAAIHHRLAIARLGESLAAAAGDEELEKRLIAALGASGSHAAVAPLLAHLPSVRTRLAIVRALGALGDRAALAPLAAAIAHEPYVTARAEMARVLGHLAPPGDRTATRALTRLLAHETEPEVRTEAETALTHLRQ